MEFKIMKEEYLPNVIEVSKDIWDGHDYIPNIFNKWVTDKDGEFLSIWDENTMVGFAKTTQYDSDRCWFEGIRVMPKVQNKKYGENLMEEQLRRAKEKGYNKALLSTYIENYASIKMIEKRGFKVLESFKTFDLGDNQKIEKVEYTKCDSYDLDFTNRYFYGFDWFFADENYIKNNELIKGNVFQLNDTKVVVSEFMKKDHSLSLVDYCGDPITAIKIAINIIRDLNFPYLTVMTRSKKLIEASLNLGFTHFDNYEINTFVYGIEL
jgi:GNAT superfamily N-acetyltransferase